VAVGNKPGQWIFADPCHARSGSHTEHPKVLSSKFHTNQPQAAHHEREDLREIAAFVVGTADPGLLITIEIYGDSLMMPPNWRWASSALPE